MPIRTPLALRPAASPAAASARSQVTSTMPAPHVQLDTLSIPVSKDSLEVDEQGQMLPHRDADTLVTIREYQKFVPKNQVCFGLTREMSCCVVTAVLVLVSLVYVCVKIRQI